jgi:hypothetical protein
MRGAALLPIPGYAHVATRSFTEYSHPKGNTIATC